LVSLRAKRSNLIVEGLLRHFVPRNDTLIISQKHFTDDSNYHNLDTSDKNNKIMSLRTNINKAKPVYRPGRQSFLLIFTAIFIFLPQKAQAQEYRCPTWMDNEHIICVKYINTVKEHLIPWFGDLSDARFIVTKQEIQLVSMDINGNNEKIIKNIIIDYPGQSPKWQEEIFKGIRRIEYIDYCPQRKLISFTGRGDLVAIFTIKDAGKEAEKIAEQAGGGEFSPDGKYLEYTSNYKVWLYDLDTKEKNILINDAMGGPWSPDGEKIAFSRKINSYWEAFIYDLQTNKENFYEEFNKKSIGVLNEWSPDGTKLATPSGAIYSLQAEYLKEISAATPTGAKWSFDGKHLVGEITEKGQIAVIDSDGKNLRILR
ncbi:MAG: hypothetical protein ABIH18_05975, partial [Candidatus Omnitrophota bacterium]